MKHLTIIDLLKIRLPSFRQQILLRLLHQGKCFPTETSNHFSNYNIRNSLKTDLPVYHQRRLSFLSYQEMSLPSFHRGNAFPSNNHYRYLIYYTVHTDFLPGRSGTDTTPNHSGRLYVLCSLEHRNKSPYHSLRH